jgi:propionyl-CoA carboxylase beta chain
VAVKRIENNIRITARERVNYLMDEGSFEEIGMLVTHRTTDFEWKRTVLWRWSHHRIWNHKRKIGLYFRSGFYSFFLSETHAEKICKVMDMAVKMERL